MTITKHIHQKIVTITANGEMLFDDIRSAIESLCLNKCLHQEFKILWDFRKATVSSISGEEIQKIVSIVKLKREAIGANKIALLVAQDVDFGISNMFLAYGDNLPFRMAVFRDFNEAISWFAHDN